MITLRQFSRNTLFIGALAFTTSISIAQNDTRSTNLDPDGVHMRSIKNPPQSAPSFTLTLSPGTRNKNISEFRVGSKVWITIKMTNITEHTIDHSDWHSDAGEMSYLWDVNDEDGKPVAKIVHLHPELDTASYYWGAISPGESEIGEVQLNRVYKFDRPGKYVIQVSRPDIDFKDANGNFVNVKSNIITITITG
jgi:hypothetical protein